MRTTVSVTKGKTTVHRDGDNVILLKDADANVLCTTADAADEVAVTIIGYRGVRDMQRLAVSIARAVRNHRVENA